MNGFLISLLGAMLATNQVTQVSNVVARTTGLALPVVDPTDPAERALRAVMEQDDEAIADAERWITEDQKQMAAGSPASATLDLRMQERFEGVIKTYDEFLVRHPKHVRGRLAYGSFLNELGRTDEARAQWEKASELDPQNPAAWNNLASLYVHRPPVTNIFVYLGKAADLNPREPVYLRNLADAISLYRKDAREFYGLPDDTAVVRRSMELYRKALELDPTNLFLATDLAQTYYYFLLKPTATLPVDPKLVDEALEAWRAAERIARDEVQRQGLYLHMARVCGTQGRYSEARRHLAQVDKPEFEESKKRLARSVDQREAGTSDAFTEE